MPDENTIVLSTLSIFQVLSITDAKHTIADKFNKPVIRYANESDLDTVNPKTYCKIKYSIIKKYP